MSGCSAAEWPNIAFCETINLFFAGLTPNTIYPMRIYKHEYFRFDLPLVRRVFKTWRLRTKLLLTLIPCVVIILLLTGYITTWFSNKFLNVVLKENIRVQTVAMASEFEALLKQCKEDLMIIAQNPIERAGYLDFLESRNKIKKGLFKELAYISQQDKDHIFALAVGSDISLIPAEHISLISPSPFLLLNSINPIKRDEVRISNIIEADYPFGAKNSGSGIKSARITRIIRLATPCFNKDNSPKGFIILSLDFDRLLKTLYPSNSPESRMPGYAETHGPRHAYIFDKNGSILFHSEDTLQTVKKPPAYIAAIPFKPAFSCINYWKIVKEVGKGKQGSIKMTGPVKYGNPSTRSHFYGYAPIRFNITSNRNPIVIGGVVLRETSNITRWAGYKQIDVMFLMTLATIIIISIVIFILSRIITRPILELATAVSRIQETGQLEKINLSDRGVETSGLKNAINNMIVTLRNQIEQLRIKDEMLEKEKQREKARLEEEVEALKKRLQSHAIKEIVGVGTAIETLKSNIIKTASVDADVLIIGETGTGKQLTAEAIHRHSDRTQKPFISINCGALDENLLSDTLFGHIKGAFTEARSNRKGAFLAADGGTLFLDEIGSASPKVQQSLLRAISIRKIRPLGSDQEIDVNVRLITATNVDLKEMIGKGLFREDLYYRLEVLTINTPSLRNHKENIPVLTNYFLKQSGRLMNKEDIGLSRGALKKMKNYHWPGNVRELMNCVTRSVAMVEGKLIHSDQINFGGGKEPVRLSSNSTAYQGAAIKKTAGREKEQIPNGLNARQTKAFPFILQKGEITRSQYQEVIGNLPSRTAISDLYDLANRGLLEKTGRGPATRYCLAKLRDSAG